MAKKRNSRRLLTDIVRDELRQSILTEVYSPGDKLPSETELADKYNVSRVTLREAVRGLVEEGYLSRQHGLGTYVTEKPRLRNNLDVNFGVTQLIQSMGMRPGNRDVHILEEEASERVRRALALGAGQAVARIERIRTADDEPIVYSTEFIPISLLDGDIGGLRNLSGSLYRFLGDLGYRVHHGVVTIEPVVATKVMARKLNVEPGKPLLHFAQVDYGEEGRPYLFSLEWYRSELLQVTVYRRGPTFLTEGAEWMLSEKDEGSAAP
ncbi:MAG: GntR family transcriptional regulator [Actinomycetota bacterium]